MHYVGEATGWLEAIGVLVYDVYSEDPSHYGIEKYLAEGSYNDINRVLREAREAQNLLLVDARADIVRHLPDMREGSHLQAEFTSMIERIDKLYAQPMDLTDPRCWADTP
jgi:hypothetical protein